MRDDGWMDDMSFYVHFNSISVISGRWAGDNERLCAIEPLYYVSDPVQRGYARALASGLLTVRQMN